MNKPDIIMVKRYINIHHKNIEVEEPIRREDYVSETRLMHKILRREEQRQKDEYELTHRLGYCPHCGMLLPLNGKCDCQE